MNIVSHISVGKFLLNFIVLATCFLQLLFFSIPQFPMSGKESTVDSRINHVVLKHVLSSSLCLAAAAGQPCCFTRTRKNKTALIFVDWLFSCGPAFYVLFTQLSCMI